MKRGRSQEQRSKDTKLTTLVSYLVGGRLRLDLGHDMAQSCTIEILLTSGIAGLMARHDSHGMEYMDKMLMIHGTQALVHGFLHSLELFFDPNNIASVALGAMMSSSRERETPVRVNTSRHVTNDKPAGE